MNKIRFLILSSTVDYSTDLVCAKLEKRNVGYLRINRDLFSTYDVVYDLQNNNVRILIAGVLYIIDAQTLRSVYFRAPVFLRITGKAYTVEEQLKLSQWNAFIRNLIVLDKALWINYPVATYKAENKLYQLKTAKECGFNVPETYAGNSLPKNIMLEKIYIVKSLDTALFYDNGNEMFTYSTMLSGQDLLSAEIKSAPIIFQEYLTEKKDLRVTVIGECIFAVSITKSGENLIGDWRKSNKENLEYTLVELPETIENKILKLMNSLGLTFGGMDLALVKDEYYFIEVNPTGEWGWLNTSVGIPIDEAIVEYMIFGGPNE